jgi:hypothetical protein
MRKAGGAELMAKSPRDRLEAVFWPQDSSSDMWMIVDGARDEQVYSTLISSYLQYSCLYAGDLPHQLERAAPYLVQLELDDRYTRRLLDQAWGNSWGVFLRCSEPMAIIRRHLRHFLKVQDPRGRTLIFRYYDPRVLRVYLPTCTREELATFFGPIKSFYLEGDEGESVWDYKKDSGKLSVGKVALVGSLSGSSDIDEAHA